MNYKYIFCAGMRRSGSAWQYMVVREVLLRLGIPFQEDGFTTWQQFEPEYNGITRLIKMHTALPVMKPNIWDDIDYDSLVVLSVRNPFDIWFSLKRFHASIGKMEVTVKDIYSTVSDYEFWNTRASNRIHMPYEDIAVRPKAFVEAMVAILSGRMDFFIREKVDVDGVVEMFRRENMINHSYKPENGKYIVWPTHVTDGKYPRDSYDHIEWMVCDSEEKKFIVRWMSKNGYL